MWSYDLKAHDLDIIPELLEFVNSTRKCYFQSKKERSLAKEKFSKDCQLAELNEKISKLNTDATLLKSTLSDLKKTSDKTLLDAQKQKLLLKFQLLSCFMTVAIINLSNSVCSTTEGQDFLLKSLKFLH